MKLAITGFSNSGKTTVFNTLTGLSLDTTIYTTSISAESEPRIGIVKIPDKRLDRLSSIYIPKKTSHATVEYIDYVGIIPISSGDSLGIESYRPAQNNKVFDLIKDSDAIVHVVRAFENDSVIHPLGGIDPVRDVKSFETELILGDLEFIEKRLERIALATRKGMKQEESDKPFLLKCKKTLEDEIPLRNISFTEEEKRTMLSFQFLSIKPEIIVLNIGEKDINTDKIKNLQDKIENYFDGKLQGNLKEKNQNVIPPVLALCGKIEMEISQLSDDDAKIFLADMGIQEQATNKLCNASYKALELISFFTVIKDEVRAWTIKKGTEALRAAGKVHSDMERGFIKAEVISFDDFVSSGEDMVKAKEKGLVRLEGKTYIVKDGDIINFKFHV